MSGSLNQRLEQRVGNLLARWVEWVEFHTRAVLAATLLATLACGAYAATHLGVDMAVNRMFTSGSEFRQLYADFAKVFPILDDALLVVIDAETPLDASRAAETLGARLEEQPELFTDVFIPGEGDFFHRNALLYLSTDELEDLADQLAKIQPLIAELARDGSLHGLVSALATAAEQAPATAFEGVDWTALLGRIDAGARAALEGSEETAWWQTVFLESFFPEDEPRRVLIVQPVLDYNRLLPASEAIAVVREAAASLGYDEASGTRVRLSGNVALNHEEMILLARQTAIALSFSLFLVAGILSIGLSSPKLIFSIVATLLVGLVATAAFAAASVGHVNMISVAFGVLFVGLGVDFGIHVGMRYAEVVLHGFSREQAMLETVRSIGASLVICAATTAVGFYVFLPTDFRAVAELGLIAGTGMFISLFCNMTVLPALLCLGATGIRPDHRAWLDFFDRGLAKFAARHARAIRLAAVGTGVACALALPYVRFDHDAVGLRDPGSESVQTMHDLLADKRQSPWNIDVLAPDLASAKRIADRLEKLDVVDHTVTALDFVPADQEEKLEILADLALFLPMETHFDPAFPRPSQQDQLELLASFRDVLRDGWGTREDQPELAAAARELAATLDRVLTEAQREGQAEPLLERLEVQLVGPLPDHLRRFWQALTPDEEGVVLSDLPSDLTSRLLAADGRARVQVLPSEDLTERPAMDRFVAGVRQLYPDATGMAVSLLETAHAIVRSLQQALAAAALVIAVLLFVMWRKVRDTLLVMAPLTLASAMICATSVLIGLSFNFANVVVLPLLLGIGVDSGIHLVHRHRISDVEGHEVLETSTARAILFSGLTTVGSFGTLAFSSHHGLASLGQLLTLGVIYMLICNLIVLPAMLVGRRQREDAARAAEVVSTAQLGS